MTNETVWSIVFLRAEETRQRARDCSDQSLADTSEPGRDHFSRRDGSFIYTLLVTAFVSEWRRDVLRHRVFATDR